MVKSEVEIGDTTIVEIDTAELEKKLIEGVKGETKRAFEEYMKQVQESDDWKGAFKEKGGKGVVEAYMPEDKKAELVEKFQGGKEKLGICEQWTIALPFQRHRELAAHLRDFVYVTDVIRGHQGDTVNIPYVKDLDFAFPTVGTGALGATTGLVGTLTTTLVEAGAYYDAYYTDIEKIDSNLLDELNAVMAHAAVRAEDAYLISLLNNGTTSAWGETIMGGAQAARLYAGVTGYGTASTFAVSWIADAIGKLIRKGKDVAPGEMVLVMGTQMYITLLKKLSALTNTAVAYAMPTVWTKGMIESYLGVRIMVSGYEPRSTSGSLALVDTSYVAAFLMRPKRCLALAPKREILIETDKQIAARTLRIVATHTFGACFLDQEEAVKICGGIGSIDTKSPGVA